MLVDFGCEGSFAKGALGLEEHYGRQLGRTTIRSSTRAEASQVEEYIDGLFADYARLYDASLPARPGRDHIVAELDGCMVRTGEIMSARRALRADVPP